MDDELLDVVNGFDEVIGTVNRKDYKQFVEEDKGFIRAVELFIVNDKGEIWIPVRTAHKTIAPNGYDYSAAGHVSAGEDYLTSLIRETQEELNLDITADDVEFVAKLKSMYIKYIRNIYLLRSNDEPAYNPNDFTGAEWLAPTELFKKLDEGHPAKSNLRDTVIVLQAYLTA